MRRLEHDRGVDDVKRICLSGAVVDRCHGPLQRRPLHSGQEFSAELHGPADGTRPRLNCFSSSGPRGELPLPEGRDRRLWRCSFAQLQQCHLEAPLHSEHL